MKKLKIVFLCLIAVVLCTGLVFATDIDYSEIFRNDYSGEDGEDILPMNTGTEKNIISFSDTVNATGIANDLIILAGGSVNSSATGDYSFIAGNIIKASDTVYKDAFMAGSDVIINGDIGRDLYVAGKNVVVNGNVRGNIYVVAGTLAIANGATVGGDVNANTCGSIVVAEGAKVEGTIRYTDTANVSIPVTVKTSVTEAKIDEEFNKENVLFSKIKSVIYWIVANTILFSILLLILPGIFDKIKKSFETKGGKVYLTSAGWGILLLIVVPIVALIALITLIASPLGFAMFIGYTFVLLVATVLVGYLLGITLFNKTQMNKWLVGFLGIVILEILCAIPFVGGLVSFVKVLVGMGIIIEILKREKIQDAPKTETIESSTDKAE